MIRAIFFDIDGTLVSFNTHTIPQSTIEAIKRAKDKGVKIFISTGRPKAFISNLQGIARYIDGYITNNGAFAYINNQTIICHQINKHDINVLINDAHQNDYPTILMSDTDFAIYNHKPIVDHIFCDELRIPININFVSVEKLLQQKILQITSFFNLEHEQKVSRLLTDCTFGRWSPDFVDITSTQADKGKALVSVAKMISIDINQTMAFGDGGNDIPIIKQAGVGVAMGNSTQEVKKHADYVTNSVDEDGIINALVRYNVI